MSSPTNVFTATNYVHNHQNDSQRIVDYFCVVGLPTKLTATTGGDTTGTEQPIFYPDCDGDRRQASQDPIVDLVVLNKSLNEVNQDT